MRICWKELSIDLKLSQGCNSPVFKSNTGATYVRPPALPRVPLN